MPNGRREAAAAPVARATASIVKSAERAATEMKRAVVLAPCTPTRCPRAAISQDSGSRPPPTEEGPFRPPGRAPEISARECRMGPIVERGPHRGLPAHARARPRYLREGERTPRSRGLRTRQRRCREPERHRGPSDRRASAIAAAVAASKAARPCRRCLAAGRGQNPRAPVQTLPMPFIITENAVHRLHERCPTGAITQRAQTAARHDPEPASRRLRSCPDEAIYDNEGNLCEILSQLGGGAVVWTRLPLRRHPHLPQRFGKGSLAGRAQHPIRGRDRRASRGYRAEPRREGGVTVGPPC